MKVYFKDNIRVQRPKEVVVGGNHIYSPSDNQIEMAGYEIREIIDPVPEPPSKEQLYKWRVVELIREHYDMDAEFAILRQRDSKKDDFEVYDKFCEECKQQAYKEIYEEL